MSDGDSTSIGEGCSNVLAPATANLSSKAVVYTGSSTVADNEDMRVCHRGVTKAKVYGTVAKGDKLELTNGQKYLIPITTGGGARNARVQAIAAAANSSGAGTIDVYLLAYESYVYMAS